MPMGRGSWAKGHRGRKLSVRRWPARRPVLLQRSRDFLWQAVCETVTTRAEMSAWKPT